MLIAYRACWHKAMRHSFAGCNTCSPCMPICTYYCLARRHLRDWFGGQGMNGSVQSLRAVMARVRGEVEAPYAIISRQSAQLAALHASADLLRHVLHHLKLVARLKAGRALVLHAHWRSPCWTCTVARMPAAQGVCCRSGSIRLGGMGRRPAGAKRRPKRRPHRSARAVRTRPRQRASSARLRLWLRRRICPALRSRRPTQTTCAAHRRWCHPIRSVARFSA